VVLQSFVGVIILGSITFIVGKLLRVIIVQLLLLIHKFTQMRMMVDGGDEESGRGG